MSQIIKPEGIELMEYLNEGYAICNKCGAVMDRREHPRGGNDIYTCPSCGWNVDVMDYEYEDDEEEEWNKALLLYNSALKEISTKLEILNNEFKKHNA